MVLVLSACAPVSSGGQQVTVDLVDFGITARPDAVSSGAIDLVIVNDGAIVHELEIFSGVDAGQTLKASNSVADTTNLDLIDEVEDILPSATAKLVVDLEPGTYLVICNLPGHYEQGMSTYVTVTDGAPPTQP
jgi:uncharacterized cupredoxin-like copper-binding protein